MTPWCACAGVGAHQVTNKQNLCCWIFALCWPVVLICLTCGPVFGVLHLKDWMLHAMGCGFLIYGVACEFGKQNMGGSAGMARDERDRIFSTG